MTTTEKKLAWELKHDWHEANSAVKHNVGDLVFWYASVGRFSHSFPTKVFKVTEAKLQTYGNGYTGMEYNGIEMFRYIGNLWTPVKKAKETRLYSGYIRPVSQEVIKEMVDEFTTRINFLNSLPICKSSSST